MSVGPGDPIGYVQKILLVKHEAPKVSSTKQRDNRLKDVSMRKLRNCVKIDGVRHSLTQPISIYPRIYLHLNPFLSLYFKISLPSPIFQSMLPFISSIIYLYLYN